MKQGLYYENDELIYYENGKPKHAGVIKIDGDIYYISSKGRAVRGRKTIHTERANGILKHGHYTFDENYKLVEGSFKPFKVNRGYRIRNFKHKLKKNKTFKKLFQKKNILPVLAACLSFGMLLWFLTEAEEVWHTAPEAGQTTVPEVTAPPADVVLPTFEEEVLLCSDAAKKLYDGEYTVEQAASAGDPYRPFVFEYQLKAESGTLLISEAPDFADFREFALPKETERIEIDNLKTGTDYHYRVLVGEEVYEGQFATAPSTRFISIPGVGNTRDIGGYTTTDGKTVRQGLLIRGTEIDGLVQASSFIPKEEMEEVQSTFGFVYDFDLRGSDIFGGKEYRSRLGNDIGHQFYNAPGYGSIFRTDTQKAIREIFCDLAAAEHYPMYLHCTYGADRTGTIVFLLQGLLGMSEEDVIREYRMTGFSNGSYAESDYMDILIEGMQSYDGDTLAEKIESYMIESVGLTEAEIESIRSIFLE